MVLVGISEILDTNSTSDILFTKSNTSSYAYPHTSLHASSHTSKNSSVSHYLQNQLIPMANHITMLKSGNVIKTILEFQINTGMLIKDVSVISMHISSLT